MSRCCGNCSLFKNTATVQKSHVVRNVKSKLKTLKEIRSDSFNLFWSTFHTDVPAKLNSFPQLSAGTENTAEENRSNTGHDDLRFIFIDRRNY